MKEKGDTWECTPLGKPAAPLEGMEKCAWSGEDCAAKKCCNDANMKCFQKDKYFGGCKFNPPKGWDNTVLGDFRGWAQVTPPAADGKDIQGNKLFCFAVQSPNGRVEEAKMIASAMEKKVGIFSCDENSIYQGGEAEKTAWKSISNTDIFISAWNQAIQEGKFWHNDWTVKADADCVFFANRLQMHLEKLRAPKDHPVYIKNCDFKFRFQGSLEVFSSKAVEMLKDHMQECVTRIGHEGGEDFFIMTCMDAMGVGSMEDLDILYDKYATGEHLILDDVSACKNAWTAAFHPFRTIDVWDHCVEVSRIAEQEYNAAHP